MNALWAVRAEYPWCPTIAVAAALGTNAIEFVAGQYFHRRASELAAAAADGAPGCGEEHDPEARRSLSWQTLLCSTAPYRLAKQGVWDDWCTLALFLHEDPAPSAAVHTWPSGRHCFDSSITCSIKDGERGGGLMPRDETGSDSDDALDMLPLKTVHAALTLRPAAATTARLANGSSSTRPQTPTKARSPVTQVLPLEPRRLSLRAHHPCAPWFRPDKGAIEPRPSSRRSLSMALTEEPLLPDHGDVLQNGAAAQVHTPQVLPACRTAVARM